MEPTLTTPDSDCIKLQGLGGLGWVGGPPKREVGGGLPPCCEIFLARTLSTIYCRRNCTGCAVSQSGFGTYVDTPGDHMIPSLSPLLV